MSTTGIPLIRYVKDYEREGIERKKFQLGPAGGRSDMHAAYATGESTEFLIKETYEPLDDIRDAFAAGGNPWNGVRRFAELKQLLREEARVHFDSIVARDYPNAADKTDANYRELRRQIITAMSDHVVPGEKVRTYVTKQVKYVRCKMRDGSGRIDKPVNVLNRLQLIKQMASEYLHHNRGAVFLNDFDLTQAFYDCFPSKMQDWLTNEQRIDPFDPNNQLDAMELADEFQRYWNIHFKNEKNNGGNQNNKRNRDNDEDQDGGGKRRQTGRNQYGNNRRGKGNGGNDGGNGGPTQCIIHGHEKFRHNWKGCFLNPYCKHFNPNEAEKFFNEQAHGPNAFYREIYNARPQANGGRHFNGQGRGFQGRGRGRGGGRGYQGGRGFQGGRGRGGGRGYQNQGYRQQGNNYQGNNYQGNYEQDNQQQQGYHYDNYNGQGGGNGPPMGQGQGNGGNHHSHQGGNQNSDGYHFVEVPRVTSRFNGPRPSGFNGAGRGNSVRFRNW